MGGTGSIIKADEGRQGAQFYLAYTGLFITVLALVMAGLIVYYRSGLYLPLRLLLLCVSLFAACAFAPFYATAAWRKKMERDLYVFPLLSFAVLLSAFSAYFLGGLAPALPCVYAALAVTGFFRALKTLRFMSAAHYVFLLFAAAFAVYVFYYFNSFHYAGVFAPEQALLGILRRDTYYHAAIAQMLMKFGTASTGMDGLVPLHYHVGSHAWFAALGIAGGTMPLLAYPFLHMIVLLPAQLLALAFCFICAGGLKRSALSYLGLALAMVLVTDAAGRPSHYVSESYAAAISALLFFWPLLLSIIRTAPEKPAGTARLCLALAAVFILGSLKISVGLLWTVALVWALLRRSGFRPAGLIAAALAALIAGIAFKIFSDPGQAAVWEPGEFALTHPLIHFLSNWIIPGLFIVSALITQKIGDLEALVRALRVRRALEAEVIALMCLAAALPLALFRLSMAWAWFFVNVPLWPAMAMLSAQWDWSPLKSSRFKAAAYAAAAVLAALGLYAAAAHLDSALRAGYLTKARSLAGPGQEVLGTASSLRPYGTGLDSLLASQPGYRAYCLIMEAGQGRGRSFAVYAPPSNRKFWTITRNCQAQSLFVPAVTGKPMLYGLLPPELKCELRFYGYQDYGPESFDREVGESELCRHARERGFDYVLVLQDLDQTGLNQVLDCAAGAGIPAPP